MPTVWVVFRTGLGHRRTNSSYCSTSRASGELRPEVYMRKSRNMGRLDAASEGWYKVADRMEL